jgi:hypothetical protein
MLTRLHVEHEVDEPPFETRTGAVEYRETCCGYLRGALEIEYAECRAQVDVVLRFETKLRGGAPATNFGVRRFIRANGH